MRTIRRYFYRTVRPPPGLARKDWEEYVRKDLKLEFIRLDPNLAGSYRQFLSQSVYRDIDELNRRYQTSYQSFGEISFPTTVPPDRIAQVGLGEIHPRPAGLSP